MPNFLSFQRLWVIICFLWFHILRTEYGLFEIVLKLYFFCFIDQTKQNDQQSTHSVAVLRCCIFQKENK